MSNSNQITGSWPRRWQHITIASRNLRPHFLIGLFVCGCGLILPACRRSEEPTNTSSLPAVIRKSTFTTPPFSTQEPERYQTTRVTTVTETGADGNSQSSQSNRVLIARDGEKRREEYSAGASGQIIYLEIPAGRFIVLPARRIYADLGTASLEIEPREGVDESTELSPDQLLNEAQSPATYEKLGTETLAGRAATKYRVVVSGTEAQNETLIWIDETLGMPVKSELTSQLGGRSSKITMEMKDLKLEVDERVFSWPSDYRKVEHRAILDLTRKETPPAISRHEEK